MFLKVAKNSKGHVKQYFSTFSVNSNLNSFLRIFLNQWTCGPEIFIPYQYRFSIRNSIILT